jgi:adenylate cyclase
MKQVTDGFTREALAERAGVDPAYVQRLIDLRILTEPEEGIGFSGGDVRRARLVRGLEEGGLPLEGIGTAVRNGDLSFRFLDLVSWDWYGGFVSKTYRQLSAETGLSFDVLQIIREFLGFARPEPDDLLREEELDVIPVVQVALRAGVDTVAVERLLRAWAESMRRLTEAMSSFYHAQIEVPLLRSGMSEAQMMLAANEAVAEGIPYIDRAIVSMYHAWSEHTWLANVVEAVEVTLEEAGLYQPMSEPPAISFLDLSGYTELTEEQGDEVAAAIAASLGDVVQRSAQDHEGRVIKWLGDGVMLYFTDPGDAVVSALELAGGVQAAGLPPAHTGIDAGPVILQAGDYFGRTVNAAARIAAHAGPGEVLVTDAVMRATRNSTVRFVDVGSVELKGLQGPMPLHRAGWWVR